MSQPPQPPYGQAEVLIRTCDWHEERYGWAQELQAAIPDSLLILDEERSAYRTYMAALRRQGTRDAWHLEDDVILTTRWTARARWAVQSHRGVIVQGYSDRKDDLTKGSRFEPGSKFGMNQCFFIPGELAPALLEYGEAWPPQNTGNYDPMMVEFMKERRLRYWLEVPSLVQHRTVPSLISPHHHANRTSRSFVP